MATRVVVLGNLKKGGRTTLARERIADCGTAAVIDLRKRQLPALAEALQPGGSSRAATGGVANSAFYSACWFQIKPDQCDEEDPENEDPNAGYPAGSLIESYQRRATSPGRPS